MTRIERLRDKANSLPLLPGVYIMKNSDGAVLYVGKSKKLKNRVVSYFVNTGHNLKTTKLVKRIEDFDYIVCKTEIEALALENVLIKRHSPKYNIKLKDAKSYPYIKVTAEEYPRLLVTRERKSDRSKYYGPYQSASGAYTALETVKRIFMLATCKRKFPEDIKKGRPCIYRDMGRCIAPCTGKVSSEEYRAQVKCAEWVLDGNIKETKAMLTAEMSEASENMNFERAAAIRDTIYALDKLAEKQKVVADERVNRDCFALYTSETEGALAVLSVRSGALVNKNEFILSLSELTGPEDAISLIVDYYDTTGNVPREVMLDFPISEEDISLLSEYLSLDTKYKVSVKIPERGDGRALCDMARVNAKEAARQARLGAEREDRDVARLSELLGLREMPKRIEAYDVSNIGDENIVTSMVVWREGKLAKADYRSFKIRTTGGADDYGSMKEALTRRLSHVGDTSPSLGEMPDLILIDGGVGQLNAVKGVLEETGLDIPVFGMVKDDYHKTRAIVDGEREISIAHEMNVYAFVYKLQEEAHRFARKISSGGKIKSMTHSTLEKIPGIGEKKAKALLSAHRLGEIKTMTVDELSCVSGISKKDAENIYLYYHKENDR